MKKITLITLAAFVLCLTAKTQKIAASGSPVKADIKKTADKVYSFSTGNDLFFVSKKFEGTMNTYHLLVCNQTGDITHSGEAKINNGVFNNFYEIHGIEGIGTKNIVLVEHHHKEAGKNTLLVRTMDNKGVISDAETEVGALEFKKMMNPGIWRSYITPDQQHLAVIGELPKEKEQPFKYKFYFLGSDLKQTKSGEFSLPLDDRKAGKFSFYASDNGDIYIVKEVYEKSIMFPIIYKVSSSVVSDNPIILSEPGKVFNYTAAFSPSGDFVLAGYYHESKSISVTGTTAKGTWVYDSGKGKEVKTHPLDNPTENLMAQKLIFNGNTAFLIGEQYSETKDMTSPPGVMPMKFTYTYNHKEITVTGFDIASWDKKFSSSLLRNWTSRESDLNTSPAYGLMNGKLTFIYNDEYRKYFPNMSANYKLPVLITVTNDGLTGDPVKFDKEFQPSISTTFDLLTKLNYVNKGNEFLILSENYEGKAKGIIFK